MKTFVTQPYLPPLEDFIPYLESIWKSKILTNGGEMHVELEKQLYEYLGVDHISLFSNGTIALLTALQTLRVTGEVITTPFSFVATAHSLLWNGLRPVFVDIDPETLNLDASKIERAITPNTTAIMPVHCYGQPCDVEAIKKIAEVYNLRVIYDAAHAFAVEDGGGSILRHGDLSVLSFHATKVFNTFEGGAIVSHNAATKQRIDYLKNFGFHDETTVIAPGINGKLSEINSAFGLLQLKSIDEVIGKRKKIDEFYRSQLSCVEGISLMRQDPGVNYNYSYFPIMVEEDYPLKRDELYEKFKEKEIFSRRYFYPLISEFPMYSALESARVDNLPVAYSVSRRVLCLPMYPTLDEGVMEEIVEIIKNP